MTKRNLIVSITVLLASIAAPLTVAYVNGPREILTRSEHRAPAKQALTQHIDLDEVIIVGERTQKPAVTRLAARTVKCADPRALVQDTAPGFGRNYDGHQTVRVCE